MIMVAVNVVRRRHHHAGYVPGCMFPTQASFDLPANEILHRHRMTGQPAIVISIIVIIVVIIIGLISFILLFTDEMSFLQF